MVSICSEAHLMEGSQSLIFSQLFWADKLKEIMALNHVFKLCADATLLSLPSQILKQNN